MSATTYNREIPQDELQKRLERSLDVLYRAGYWLVPSSRFLRIRKEFQRYAEAAAGAVPLKCLNWHLLSQGMLDAYQLHAITTCQPIMSNYRREVQQMLSGPPLPRGNSRTFHRDLQFQLFVAANLSHMGFSVSLEEPDIRVEYRGVTFGVAVKRIHSARRLAERIEEANKQIDGQDLGGFVALGLEDLGLGEDGMVTLGPDEDLSGVAERLYALAEDRVMSLPAKKHALSALGYLLWVFVPAIRLSSGRVELSENRGAYYQGNHRYSELAREICLREPSQVQ